ncbi:MAG: thiamine-phosphate kinase [Gammaproteobacteria bacterium]|nr:thiamine-phosphate kinase [Gammaproteobacteria bacterium]|tara:strand:+ start:32884 stop:33834 length:951 start_codon:yes stop_codon:yes gene_type:complete
MIKNEEDLVKYILSNINTSSSEIIQSIGDDCSVLKINQKKSYIITTDTSLLGPHFTKDYKPDEIGYKSLSTNLSDIAAMGCIPKFFLMSITLPKLDDKWIKSFYKGVNKLVRQFKLTLIGGDVNKGPLSITIQVIGVNKNKILYRSMAKINDDIYVTGKLGGARAALIFKNNKDNKNYKRFERYLKQPLPRIEIGKEISKIANSCIDVSDGLLKDLNNIISMSKVGAVINLEKIPTHSNLKKILKDNLYYQSIIGGGEDYELCFTAHTKMRNKIRDVARKTNTKITPIGKITKKNLLFMLNGLEKKFNFGGFDHFE